MIVLIAIAICLVGAGYLIGYCSAKLNLEKEANGYLHIVNSTDEPQPYIFLELKDSSAEKTINEARFVTLEVARD